MRALFLLACVLMMSSSPVRAQDPGLKPGPGETIINLSATERMTLGQDLLQASLRIDTDGKDAKTVQKEINDKMKAAIALTKDQEGVKVTTGQYYVYGYDPNPQPVPVDGKAKKIEQRWRGSQTIDLESKTADKVLTLSGQIQEMGFVMNGLNYTLSVEKSESIRDELMTKALTKLKQRAEIAAKALGKSKVDLIEVNVDATMPYNPPVMMKAGMARDAVAESMPAPSAEAGETDVTMTVSARALLK